MSVSQRDDDVDVSYDYILLQRDIICRLIERWLAASPGLARRRGWRRQVRQARRLSLYDHTPRDKTE